MFLGYRMKKRSLPAYDKVIVPELKGYRSSSEEQPVQGLTAKRRLKGALRAAACIVLAFTLIGLVVSNNLAGEKNSFTLVAYAASASGNPSDENNFSVGTRALELTAGVPLPKNTVITLPVMTIYIGQDAEGNNYGSSSNDFSSFEGVNIVSIHADYSSGFQFSGDNIDSVTMTSQNGKFRAYDLSVVNSIYQKTAKIIDKGNGLTTCIIDDKLFSDEDKAFLDSHIQRGQTITFPPDGYTAYWGCTISDTEKTSDTITITINYSNGTTQESVVSISENEYGVITAEMN